MKKYLVAEIPPYCQQRKSADAQDEDSETGESKEGTSAEVMDCLSSLDGKTDAHGGTESIFV